MVSVNGVFSQPSKDYSSNGASEATTGIKEASLVPKPSNEVVGKSQISNINNRVKTALESLYHDSCTVYEYVETENANFSTGFEETVVYEDIPCRLSYEDNNNAGWTYANQTEYADIKGKAIKLFLDCSYEIKAGSKIKVSRLGKDTLFKSAGEAARYPSHQEVVLELYDKEA